MDHFNVTVHNGVLVSTRKGLRVSKEKHNGLSFVNLYSKNAPTEPTVARSGHATLPASAQAVAQRFEFVTKDRGGRKADAGKSRRRRYEEKEGKSNTEDTDGDWSCETRSRQPARWSGDQHASADSCSSLQLWGAKQNQESLSIVHLPNEDVFGLSMATRPLRSLPSWTTHDLPSWMSEDNMKMFHNYFSVVPRKMYPFEDILTYNPSRERSFYDYVIQDPAALNCVLMCGSMFEAVAKGDKDALDLAYFMSKICAIINRQLDNKPKQIGSVTIECITTMALIGNYVGRYDHWRLHMQGLQRMIEVNGGLAGLRPALLTKIYKADIKGATTLGTSPLLTFKRFHPNASDSLPLHRLHQVNQDISSLLAPLSIAPSIVNTLVSLAKLVQAYAAAKDPISRLALDPYFFTEEWHDVQYQLVSDPGPLRSEPPPTDKHISSDDDCSTRTDYVSNHHAAVAASLAPAPADNAFEAVLRICCLLYLKELLPDFPRNLGGYAILLALLTHHLRNILDAHRVRRHTACLAATVRVDPRLREMEEEAEAEHLAALRPVLIWICLVGNAVSLVGNKNEWRYGGDRYDRSLYRECLAEMALLTAECVGELDEACFAMCRLLDLRHIQNDNWDDRSALIRILSEATPS